MKQLFMKSTKVFTICFLILMIIASSGVFSINQSYGETIEKNNKTASSLNKNLETKVKLSFPGKQEIEPTDIVFVVDKSGMSAETEINMQTKQFLEEIKAHAEDKGLNIKAGVVLFNKIGNIKQELTDITTGYDDTLKALNQSVNSGTNIQAGLLAAKEMLDNDTEVEAEIII